MPPRRLFPIALRLDGLACLVVGGGPVAARKAAALVEAGGRVTVVAPATCEELERLDVAVERRRYQAGEAAGYRLVVTATGLDDVDAAVAADAEAAGVLVNAADAPDACRFYLPAVVRRGSVTVAVSTGGASPYLAGWLRDRVAEVVGPEFAALADLLAGEREAIRASGGSTERVDWAALVDDELVRLVAAGDDGAVAARLADWRADQPIGDGGGGDRAD